jgi:citrate lyase beta subunit
MDRSPDRLRRSVLFVPGNRSDRFDKAVASGADIVCLDLEDGVQVSDKPQARGRVLEYLAGARPHCEIAVRINSPRSQFGLQDLLGLAQAVTCPDLVVVPKVESAAEVAWVSEILGEHRPPPGIVPFVETVEGVTLVGNIAAAAATAMVGLGTGDLSVDMGVTMDWEPMLLARLQLVQAAKKARVPALDGGWLQVDDLAGLALEAQRSAALGYTAKVCLHPRQVDTVHMAFTPDEVQIRQARELIAAFEAAESGVCLFKGRMVDLPVVESARRQVQRWEAAKPR